MDYRKQILRRIETAVAGNKGNLDTVGTALYEVYLKQTTELLYKPLNSSVPTIEQSGFSLEEFFQMCVRIGYFLEH